MGMTPETLKAIAEAEAEGALRVIQRDRPDDVVIAFRPAGDKGAGEFVAYVEQAPGLVDSAYRCTVSNRAWGDQPADWGINITGTGPHLSPDFGRLAAEIITLASNEAERLQAEG